MFTELLKKAKENIESVRAVLRTNEQMRTVLFGAHDLTTVGYRGYLSGAIGVPPDATGWRIFDHCAGLTRLYTIYEQFVSELARDWLIMLPALVVDYKALEKCVVDAHRIGVAKLLQNIDQARFSHLSCLEVTKGYVGALAGESPYELIPEAFLSKDHNYRRGVLEQLFASLSIPNSWAWIQKSRSVVDYLNSAGKDAATPTGAESELREFIKYRNEAAHGPVDVDDVLGLSSILEMADFIEALCVAMSELGTWNVLTLKSKRGGARRVGAVTERIANGAVVAFMSDVEIAVGDTLYVCGEACCYSATILSIRLQNKPKDELALSAETEVGLMFDLPVKKNRTLFKVM
jgi:hypothetical protein